MSYLIDWSLFTGLILLGLLLAKGLSIATARGLRERLSVEQARLARRVVFHGISLLFILSALQQVGIKLNILLGAAGILSIAIGFASQTTVSNFISGLFLILEKQFDSGDKITANNITGTVLGIDLLSTRIKTAENTLVRIPNDSLLKSNIQNLTYYPTRCLTLPLSFPGDTLIPEKSQQLIELAKSNHRVLSDPSPNVTVDSINTRQINLNLSVWCQGDDITRVKTSLLEALHRQLKANSH